MTIERQLVSSSNIKSIGHDKDNSTLAVEFSDGSVYHYHDVSEQAYQDLLGAKSIGAHLYSSIRGIYKHSKQ